MRNDCTSILRIFAIVLGVLTLAPADTPVFVVVRGTDTVAPEDAVLLVVLPAVAVPAVAVPDAGALADVVAPALVMLLRPVT